MSRPTKLSLTRSASFYAVLFVVVGPIYAIAPLAWAFVLYASWTGAIWSYTPLWVSLYLWALLEIAFSAYHFVLARRVTATPPRPPPDRHVVQAAISRMLKAGLANLPVPKMGPVPTGDSSHDEEQDAKERGSVPRLGSPSETVVQLDFHNPCARDFRECLRTWFHKKPWSQIHVQEMREWIFWTTFNAHLPPESELSPVHKAALDEGLATIQKRAGATIKQGSNSGCRPLLLTLDPVTVHPRPLAYYVSVWAATYCVTSYFQRHWGLKYGKCGELEYLVRLPKGTGTLPVPRPLVFIHGLGLGILLYRLLLWDFLRVLPSHPILIILQPHISQNIFHPRFLSPLSREESVYCLTRVIRELGWEDGGVDMLSHSNGSYYHAWMLKSCPGIIKRSCFVDPVTFCSWEGDSCYNFVYKPCSTGIQLIIRYFVGSELGIANFIQRHFDWSENALWFEEIPNALDPRKASFFLGGKDEIINSQRVKRYLVSHGVRKGLWFDPKGCHGQALIAGGEGMHQILKWLLNSS